MMLSVPDMNHGTGSISTIGVCIERRHRVRLSGIRKTNHIDLCQCQILQTDNYRGKEKLLHDWDSCWSNKFTNKGVRDLHELPGYRGLLSGKKEFFQ